MNNTEQKQWLIDMIKLYPPHCDYCFTKQLDPQCCEYCKDMNYFNDNRYIKNHKTFKTKEFDCAWESGAIKGLQYAESIFLKLKPLKIKIKNRSSFGYTIAQHEQKGYYLFVIKENIIYQTKWITTRKEIGRILPFYAAHKLILYYPISQKFRYYVSRQADNPVCYKPIRYYNTKEWSEEK